MTESPDGPDQAYIALIGDIVGSRKLADRASVQEQVKRIIGRVNEREEGGLQAPLKLTGGDEVKTLFTDPVVAVNVIPHVSEALHPISLVWGLGRGSLNTPWDEDVGSMDGPCFHRARRAIEEASQEGVWGKVYGFSPRDDRVLSGFLRLMGSIRASWTEKQIRYIRAVRDKNRTQEEIARDFGVGPSAVSMALQRAHFRDIEEGEEILRDILATYRDADGRHSRAGADEGESS